MWWRYVWRPFGFLWCLPATLIGWVFYVIPAWVIPGGIRWDGWSSFLIARFVVEMDHVNWYTRLWYEWGGFGGPCFVILRRDPDNDPRYARTEMHEADGHGVQWLIFGVLLPVLYIAFLLVAWPWAKIVNPRLHPYYDNPFERWARRVAGQKVDLEPSEWAHGANDHWPWW